MSKPKDILNILTTNYQVLAHQVKVCHQNNGHNQDYEHAINT